MLKIVRCFYVAPYVFLLCGWLVFGFLVLLGICGVEAYAQMREERAKGEGIQAQLEEWDEEKELGNDWPWDDVERPKAAELPEF